MLSTQNFLFSSKKLHFVFKDVEWGVKKIEYPFNGFFCDRLMHEFRFQNILYQLIPISLTLTWSCKAACKSCWRANLSVRWAKSCLALRSSSLLVADSWRLFVRASTVFSNWEPSLSTLSAVWFAHDAFVRVLSKYHLI